MKQLKKSGIYKAANVTFNPETNEAYSYAWWRFVGVVNGRVIFNNYRYSVTTAKHQSKVRSLMAQLGIEIDHEFACPKGLQNAYWAESSFEHYAREMVRLESAMAKPGTRKAKNAERAEQLAGIRAFMELVAKLGKIKSSRGKEIVASVRNSEEFFAKRAAERKQPKLTLVA